MGSNTKLLGLFGENDLAESAKKASQHFQFQIDGGIAPGLHITTGTQILIQLAFSDSKYDQLSILDSVIKTLEITPEDFEKHRRNEKRATNLDYDTQETYSWE